MKWFLLKASIAPVTVAALVVSIAVGCGDRSNRADIPSGRTPLPGAAKLPARSGNFRALCTRSSQKQFTAPVTVIDPARNYTAVIETAKGDIKIQLNPQAAPVTVNSFVFLACSGFYDGVTFHRVIPGFVAQGGDPTGTGSGGPGYTLPDEYSQLPFSLGTIAMASTSPGTNSAGSQFFICLRLSPESAASLFQKYTVFGKVTAGLEVLDQLTPRDPQADPGAAPGEVIKSITVTEH